PLTITGARAHNLKRVVAHVPLHTLTWLTGVSGSGKSTLVHDTLYRAAARHFKIDWDLPGDHDEITGLDDLRGGGPPHPRADGRPPAPQPRPPLKRAPR